MSQASALYRVQEIELAVIDRRIRIKEIDLELENNVAIQEAQSQLNDAQTNLDAVLKQVKDIEQQIETVVEKQKSTESRLYSGAVKNPKELQDMGKEIESLTRRRESLDNNLLEIMIERDEALEMHQLADEELKQVKETSEAGHKDLLDEKTKLTKESEKLMVQRKDALQSVHADALKEYNSLRNSKSNRPVAILENQACSACGIDQNNAIITAVNKGEGLIKCQNCGRILSRR